ncbi:hypothetical protein BO71DRAFT_413076 [Aspergillus ellipticus CBS 707.79]|uniref:Uncharacterized protein n=1 Tax=Aspergillus ellipticus CBS 707.79 TaxID=1448320 RepID=A0A319CYK7_9EURO|nr:hypothetical protein BO71DRAFT_413076 [Aspergillus ellipticus CBS 707.79]
MEVVTDTRRRVTIRELHGPGSPLKIAKRLVNANPDGGPPVLLAEIKSEHTKKFLGTSQVNNFPFSEVINGPSLVFSPHTLIFGILLLASSLRSPCAFLYGAPSKAVR